MARSAENASFHNVKNDDLRKIISDALKDMKKILEETPCLGAVAIADQLNEIKKEAFEKLYGIGRETMEQELSEEVLKAIRALQDAFGQIIVAISPMDNLRHCFEEIWFEELDDS